MGSWGVSMWEYREVPCLSSGGMSVQTVVQGGAVQPEHVGVLGRPECEQS